MLVDITIPEFHSAQEAESWAHTFEGIDPIRRKLRDHIKSMKAKLGVLSQEDVQYPQRILSYAKKMTKIAMYELAYDIMLEAKERKGASTYAGSVVVNQGYLFRGSHGI